MASTSETGHARNVANFEQLLTYIAGYGTVYNPSKAALKLAAMQALATNAKNAVGVVNSSFPPYSNAVAAREIAFLPLSKLVSRVMSILKSTDTSTQVDDSAKTFARKIQGNQNPLLLYRKRIRNAGRNDHPERYPGSDCRRCTSNRTRRVRDR